MTDSTTTSNEQHAPSGAPKTGRSRRRLAGLAAAAVVAAGGLGVYEITTGLLEVWLLPGEW